jgi:NTP pyrophosphatase (non-canonical NTP hydrolase)
MSNIKRGWDAIQHLCYNASVKAGWWNNTNPGTVPTKLCLIHSEVSEAMEGHRKDLMDDKLPHRKAIEVELADAIIRIADLAGYLELDVGGAIEEKMKFNETRPDHKPEVREAAGGKSY